MSTAWSFDWKASIHFELLRDAFGTCVVVGAGGVLDVPSVGGTYSKRDPTIFPLNRFLISSCGTRLAQNRYNTVRNTRTMPRLHSK